MIRAAYVVEVLPASHELRVELTLEGLDPSQPLKLATPTWVPGAYGFMKYGRDVFDVQIADSSGRALPFVREGWSGYRVDRPTAALVVKHRSYGYDPTWGEIAGLIDHQYAVVMASRLLHAVEHRGPVTVEYRIPKGWTLHHPGQVGSKGPRFEYPHFQKLLDTPVVAGELDVRTRDIDGVRFHHVFLDKTLGFDSSVDDFMDRLERVSRSCAAVFGSFPFREYSWIFTFSPGAHWGLEHADATMIALEEDTFIDAAERNKGLRVCAHELLHAWNVCRLKPAPLEKADLVGGSFPDALWVAEGFTRYYEFLIGVRSGEAKTATFLSNVVNYLRTMSSHPAYARVSAADSSRASFLNHNRYPGSVNNTIDYYDKGMLIAFDIDATLRLNGRATLDGELRAFYEKTAGKGEGYSSNDLITFLVDRNPELKAVLPVEVDAPGSLSVLAQLEKLGFEVIHGDVARLGLVLDENKGPKIANVADTLPAGQSGIAPTDEITRIDGFPYSLKRLSWAIKKQPQVRLTVKRAHRELTFAIAPAKQREVSKVIWRGSSEQKARLETWLGQPLPDLKAGEPISLESHENFHSIQSVI